MGIKMDGKLIATMMKNSLKEVIAKEETKPHLVVISTGLDDASKVYVRNKKRACEDIGMGFTHLDVAELDKDSIIGVIERANSSKGVTGIIVQLPLREDLDEEEILKHIDPSKDVDNFHPYNLGSLMRRREGYCPCTPSGIITLLKRYKIELDGKHCVIIGRSNIVGKPMAMSLLRENATVTVCHSHTKNLKDITKQADILISATGQAKMITPNYIKDGVVLVDVGMNRDENGKLCGDIDPACYDKSSYYTPVPGGVGQMTVVSLLVSCASDVVCD